MNWHGANAFADNLNIGGHTGWRMASGEVFPLWDDWHAASVAEFGYNAFEQGFRGRGADTGLNSHLFPGDSPLLGRFWSNAQHAHDLAEVSSFDWHWTDAGPADKSTSYYYRWGPSMTAALALCPSRRPTHCCSLACWP